VILRLNSVVGFIVGVLFLFFPLLYYIYSTRTPALPCRIRNMRGIALLAHTILVAGASVGPGRQQDIPVTPAAAEAFNAARRLQQSGDLQGAEREYMASLRHTPDFPHALTALADLRMDAGRLDEAEKMYVQIVRVHPAWAPAASSLGFLYMEAGHMDKAIEQLSRVVALNPTASALLNLGAVQKQAGHLPEAIISYRQAREADPAEPRGAYNLGNALYAHGDLAAAIEQYRESNRLNPAHTDSLNNLANALRDAGDRAGSLRTLEQAVALDPLNVAALCNLGGLYYDTDDFAKSLDILDRALALAPSVPEVICSRANTLHRLNETAAAIGEYRRVVEALPHVPAYRRGLADLLSAAGHLDEAVAHFESAHRHGGGEEATGPDAAAVLTGQAEVYRKQGDLARAIDLYKRATAAHPADPRIHMNAAVVLADERRLAEALPMFRTAVALKPDDALVPPPTPPLPAPPRPLSPSPSSPPSCCAPLRSGHSGVNRDTPPLPSFLFLCPSLARCIQFWGETLVDILLW
jgi:tetratricopeptide (TPR) repeat protein